MNLHATTYPPHIHTHTGTVPPTSPTAFTGAPGTISWMVPAALILVVVGAIALRFAARPRRM